VTAASEPNAPWRRAVAIALFLVVLLFAAHLRLRAAAETVLRPALQGDSIRYVSMAYNLKKFDTLSAVPTWSQPSPAPPAPEAFSPPGYPILLAGLMDGLPDHAFLARALRLQAWLGVLVVLAGFLMARTLLPRGAAIAVAALLAMSPQLVTLGTSLLTEVPFTLAVACFGAAISVAAIREDWRWYALAGLALGICALLRPTLQYLPVLLVPAMLWLSTRHRWKACGALLLAYALLLGPLLIRNQVSTGAISDPATMANGLLHGSYPDFMFEGRKESFGYPYRFDPEAKAIRTPALALARIGGNFAADPLGTARWYLLGKPLRFHDWGFAEASGSIFLNRISASPYLTRTEFVASYHAMHWLHPLLMLLGAAGLGLALVGVARREREPQARARGLLAITLLFAILLHVATLPFARYAIPFRPLTYLFALDALLVLYGAARRRWP